MLENLRFQRRLISLRTTALTRMKRFQTSSGKAATLKSRSNTSFPNWISTIKTFSVASIRKWRRSSTDNKKPRRHSDNYCAKTISMSTAITNNSKGKVLKKQNSSLKLWSNSIWPPKFSEVENMSYTKSLKMILLRKQSIR